MCLLGTPLLLLSNVRRGNVLKGSHIAQRPQEEKWPAGSFCEPGLNALTCSMKDAGFAMHRVSALTSSAGTGVNELYMGGSQQA